MMARSEIGNLAHKLGFRSDVVTRCLDSRRKNLSTDPLLLGSANFTSLNRPRQNSYLPGNMSIRTRLRPAYAGETIVVGMGLPET
jgi:hypothetical protein